MVCNQHLYQTQIIRGSMYSSTPVKSSNQQLDLEIDDKNMNSCDSTNLSNQAFHEEKDIHQISSTENQKQSIELSMTKTIREITVISKEKRELYPHNQETKKNEYKKGDEGNNEGKNYTYIIFIVLMIISILMAGCYFRNRQEMNHLYKHIEAIRIFYEHRIDILEEKNRELEEQNIKILNEIRQVRNDIEDLQIAVMESDEPSFHIAKKYSEQFEFKAKDSTLWFQDHFRLEHEFDETKVEKLSEEQKMFYSKDPLPQEGIHYNSIKILYTLARMISIGIMPKKYLSADCVYCDSSQIFYLYCYNGKVYNGEILSIYNDNRKSKVLAVSTGDVVTTMINMDDKYIQWYVNGKFAARLPLLQEVQKENLHLFVEITNMGDQIQLNV